VLLNRTKDLLRFQFLPWKILVPFPVPVPESRLISTTILHKILPFQCEAALFKKMASNFWFFELLYYFYVGSGSCSAKAKSCGSGSGSGSTTLVLRRFKLTFTIPLCRQLVDV
jgi:hypothetical protein